jgi:hypothetical protein
MNRTARLTARSRADIIPFVSFGSSFVPSARISPLTRLHPGYIARMRSDSAQHRSPDAAQRNPGIILRTRPPRMIFVPVVVLLPFFRGKVS